VVREREISETISPKGQPPEENLAVNVQFIDGGTPMGVKITDPLPPGNNTIGKVDQGLGGASPWKVDGSGVVQPVSATSWPLPTGAATEATLAAIKDLDGIKKITDPLPAGTNTIGKVDQGAPGLSAWKVDGSGVVQPVSATSWPLPTGASTEATLAAIKNTDGVKKITDPLPAGNNNIGDVDVITQPARSATTDSITAKIATDAIHNGLTPLTPKYAFANVAPGTADGVIVSAVTGKKIRVLAAVFVCGATATDCTFRSKPAGTGTAISCLFANAANGGAALPFNPVGWFETNVSEGLTLNTGSGASVGVQVAYVEV